MRREGLPPACFKWDLQTGERSSASGPCGMGLQGMQPERKARCVRCACRACTRAAGGEVDPQTDYVLSPQQDFMVNMSRRV